MYKVYSRTQSEIIQARTYH